MAKSRAGVRKLQRLLALRDVFERWGKLDYKQVSEHVRAIFPGVGISKKTLYRDLSTLVDDGFLRPVNEEGEEVDVDAGPSAKGKKYYWLPARAGDSDIPGIDGLRSVGCDLTLSSALRHFVQVHKGRAEIKGAFVVTFAHACEVFTISLDAEAVKFSLLVGRTVREESREKLLTTFESYHGKRILLLQLPIARLSRFKENGVDAHFKVSFISPDTVDIIDLNSSNGTSAHGLPLTAVEGLSESYEVPGKTEGGPPGELFLAKESKSGGNFAIPAEVRVDGACSFLIHRC